MPAGNDNADWRQTVEIAACERWQLKYVAGNVAAPDWYDAVTTRMLSEGADSLVSAFGIIDVESRPPGSAYRRAVLSAVDAGGFARVRTARSSMLTASMRSESPRPARATRTTSTS